MKKTIFVAFSALLAFTACEEFQPVFISKYEEPAELQPAKMVANTTIADLTKLYSTGTPVTLTESRIISGVVSTTDQPGNFYKSFYIQDATGGIEIKVGKNALYNDYRPGQTIFVDCVDLTVGMYGYKAGQGNGMVQVGFKDPTGEYENSYIELPLLIDAHIFRGERSEGDQLPAPVVLSESQLPGPNDTQATNANVGRLVTIKNLSYGWIDPKYPDEHNTAFALLYLDSNKDKKSSSNRIFVTGDNTHINTWALSKTLMTEMLLSGVWDNFDIGNAGDYNYGKVGDEKYKGDGTYPGIEKAAASISQYFKTPNGTCVQVRTSGFCKFSDKEIPAEVLNGTKTIDVTGVLALYQGKIQMVVNNISDICVDGKPLE